MAQQPFKDWKTFAEQIDLLEQRGMVFHDKAQAEKELARIGYYRLSAYCIPENRRVDGFKPLATLEIGENRKPPNPYCNSISLLGNIGGVVEVNYKVVRDQIQVKLVKINFQAA